MSRCRIINGRFKRRYITAPATKTTRPTSDIVKQAIFNVLIHRFHFDFQSAFVIDLFAGSGSLGIEAISCGCNNVLFVDSNIKAIECIKKNIRELDIEDKADVILNFSEKVSSDVFKELRDNYDTVMLFLDPPYSEKELLKSQIFRFTELFKAQNLIIVAESDEEIPNSAYIVRHGNTFASILHNSQ